MKFLRSLLPKGAGRFVGDVFADIQICLSSEKRKDALYITTINRMLERIIFLGLYPFTYSYKEKKVKKGTSGWNKFFFYFAFFASMLQIAFFGKWYWERRREKSIIWKMVMLYFLDVKLLFPVMTLLIGRRRQDVMETIQWCYEIEETAIQERGFANHVKKKVVIMFLVFVSSCWFTTATFFVLSYVFPCFPGSVGFHIIPSCAEWDSRAEGTWGWGLVVFASLWETYIWLNIWSNVNICLVQGMAYPAEIAEVALATIVARSTPKTDHHDLVRYRSLQLLFNRVNGMWETPVLYMYIGAYVTAGVVSLYAVVKLHSLMPLPIVLFFAIIAHDVFTGVNTLFHLMSKPYIDSEKFQREYKETPGFATCKWRKRFLASCAPLQISFGGRNFFDRLTALRITQFICDRFVQSLIAKK